MKVLFGRSQADDRVRREPVPADWAELDGAGLQHIEPSPEDAGREHPASGGARPAASLVDSTGIKVEGEGECHRRSRAETKCTV